MFLTYYNRYTSWTPAEGGFYLVGHTHEGNNFMELQDREAVIEELKSSFFEVIEDEGYSKSEIEIEESADGNVQNWKVSRGEGSNQEMIVLHINHKAPLFENYVEREDGYEDEDYSSYLWIWKNSRYVDEIVEWELIPESKYGLHERPAIYC